MRNFRQAVLQAVEVAGDGGGEARIVRCHCGLTRQNRVAEAGDGEDAKT